MCFNDLKTRLKLVQRFDVNGGMILWIPFFEMIKSPWGWAGESGGKRGVDALFDNTLI